MSEHPIVVPQPEPAPDASVALGDDDDTQALEQALGHFKETREELAKLQYSITQLEAKIAAMDSRLSHFETKLREFHAVLKTAARWKRLPDFD